MRYFLPAVVINLLYAVLCLPHIAAQSLHTTSDIIPFRKGDKWGFCDKSKNLKIPAKYDNASRFIGGVARVQIGGKWGMVNATGQEVLTTKYDWVETAADGVVRSNLPENGA